MSGSAGGDDHEDPHQPAKPRDEDDHPDPILASPTANPRRTRVPAEGLHPKTDQDDPETSGPPPGEET
ncbi:hypothetical protein ACLQ3D_28220 [Micromonospora vinacea]|uniref:Uncharacterized protein n=1 Tax=Micromonospora vinacea TaxID=709878 RepID=A0ABS0K715_9ACTN|nr:hypothetical protein [Micromonospora vinacea]MBG6104404.1 hypothetical protein [Micromonospora vinacea]WSZ79345.1 hypothetical protein OH804_12975 [Micromonospora sp. NBC_00860]WTA70561.1 hypothetical protein OHB51_15955 [Micromonospora sp. NBC_00855]